MTKKEIISLNLERYEMLMKIKKAKDPEAEIRKQLETLKSDLESRGISTEALEIK